MVITRILPQNNTFPKSDDQFQTAIKLFYEVIGKMTDGQVLFLIDDSIAEEGIDKKRSALIKLACSGRHDNCSLWILSQAYVAVPKTIRRQVKWLSTFWCKDENDFDVIMKENNVVPISERQKLNKNLEKKQYSKLILFLHPPRGFCFAKYNK